MAKEVLKTAYECEFCNDTFSTKSGATRHEKKCRAMAEKEAKHDKNRKIISDLKNYVRFNAETVDDIPRLMSEQFVELFGEEGKNITIEITNCSFNENISITHSAPIGVKSEFRSTKSFPGFYGRIIYNISEFNYLLRKFDDRLYENLSTVFAGINTGTGGGGSYELRLYLDDFPKIKEQRELNVKCCGEIEKFCEAELTVAMSEYDNNCEEIDAILDAIEVERRVIQLHEQNRNALRAMARGLVDTITDSHSAKVDAFISQFDLTKRLPGEEFGVERAKTQLIDRIRRKYMNS